MEKQNPVYLSFWRGKILPDAVLIGYCILLLILGWSFVLWDIEHDRKTTESSIVNINDKLALAFENHTNQALVRVERTLDFLKADFEANGIVTPSVQLLVRQQVGDPLINQSVAADEKGKLLTSALDSVTNLYNAPQFQAHIKTDTGRIFIGRPRVGLISNKESIHVSKRLNKPDGTFAGMVSVAVKPEYFTTFYQAMELGIGQVTVALIGLDRVIRASQYPKEAGKIDTDSLFAAIAHSSVGHYVTDRYYSYRVIGNYPLVVQVGVSGEEAFAEFHQRRFAYLAGCAGMSMLIILYTGMLMRSSRKQRALQTRDRALMEQSFEALALVDIEKQEVVEVNQRFTELFGYSLPEDAPLTMDKYMTDTQSHTDRVYNTILKEQRILPPEAKTYRHKNGTAVYGEWAGTVISIDGRDYLLGSMRDMTEERRRQAELTRDVELARRVQRGLLPELPDSRFVVVKTFYYPSNFVSGDSYHLQWLSDDKLLRGFLVDVSGHGVATAIQTSAVSVLLREAAMSPQPLIELMRWVNTRLLAYFTDGAFAAILSFELDLASRELRYVGAGITQFYANGRKVETPGMFAGLWEEAEFNEGVLPVAEEDTFCFLTDGFTDVLAQPENANFWSPAEKDFDAHVAALNRLASHNKLRDDATGVCLKINKLL